MMRRPFDGSALLYWLLIGLVLFAYMAPVYVAITQTFPLHDITPPLTLNLLALAVLLATYKPVWRWVQPRVHHIVYAADEPNIDVIGQISNTLTHATPDSSMLATIAETITQIAKVPYVRVEMLDGTTVEVGTLQPTTVYSRVDITYGDVLVGWVDVSSRLPGEPLTNGEYQLLHHLARQVGVALHAAQLNEALQASREQLVTAREEERRRIRRDLHDGLGPTLAGLRMQLSALRHSVRDDPTTAEALIDSLRDDVRAATADIRRLVYDLRPPLLDEHGLLGAIRHLSTLLDGVTLTLDAPATLPPLTAAVEVAVYRIAAEAVQNVAKHANASACLVQLALDAQMLTLRVADNGVGLPEHYAAGVGFASMRERATELGGQLVIEPVPGGGTCITATIPCRVRV